MSLTLYQLPFSPFCLPVVRVLEAVGAPFATVDIPSWDRRAIIEKTGGAYYQVPLLEHDGRLVFESGSDTQDVARHLDRELANGRLFPERWEGWQAILLPYLENEVELATFKLFDRVFWPAQTDLVARAMSIRHKERKFGRGCVDRWVADGPALAAEARRLLGPLDATLRVQPWLVEPAGPVYADFLLWGILAQVVWGGLNPFPADLPALEEWFGRMGGFTF